MNMPLWTPTDRPALITAMLTFWAERATNLRTTCHTREEARTKNHEKRKEAGHYALLNRSTGIATPVNPHHDDKRDSLCRYVKTGVGAPAGDQHTVVMYAKWKEGKGFWYDVLRVVTCHAECGFPEGGVTVAFEEVARDFAEEDMAKARAVRAEW